MNDSIQLFPLGFYEFRSHFHDRQPTVLLPTQEDEEMCVMLSDPELAEIRTTWIAPARLKASNRAAADQKSADATFWISRIGD